MDSSDTATVTDSEWADLLEVRVADPAYIAARYAARTRRPLLGDDGNTFIVAADHPARRANAVRDEPLAMADRRSLLDRLCTALANPRVDGVMATPDVLDELLLLGRLEGKVAVGSINRGGLAGSVWELDDGWTGHDVASILEQRLDGGKMLLRIDPDDERSKATIEACARFITELARIGLPAIVEPLPYVRGDGRSLLDPSSDELIRCIGVASALGVTSAYTWLKLPATDDVVRVMAATSLPALMLGGAPGPDPEETFAGWRKAMAVPNVRGLVAGRSLLYPPDGDVAAAVSKAAAIVHGDASDQ